MFTCTSSQQIVIRNNHSIAASWVIASTKPILLNMQYASGWTAAEWTLPAGSHISSSVPRTSARHIMSRWHSVLYTYIFCSRREWYSYCLYWTKQVAGSLWEGRNTRTPRAREGDHLVPVFYFLDRLRLESGKNILQAIPYTADAHMCLDQICEPLTTSSGRWIAGYSTWNGVLSWRTEKQINIKKGSVIRCALVSLERLKALDASSSEKQK